jgi:inner membrane protein
MDPLTHTLVGASLATRLKEKTRFATAALVVGANLPDVDGICYLIDSDLAIGFRRGWTHGTLALVLLPLFQAGFLYALGRRSASSQRTDFRWLLFLSAVAVWSHPTLDWLNTYGMRWLMPFDGRWFYGDSVYIMDLWLWLVLGVGYLAGRRATAPLLITAVVIGGWIVRTVALRSPEYLPLLVAVVVIFVLALLWKRPVERPELGRRLALGALTVACIYVVSRVVLNEMTESAVVRSFEGRGQRVEALMAGPHPLSPLKWTVVARTGEVYRYGEFDWSTGALTLRSETVMAAKESEAWSRAKKEPSVRGLVTWMRFPAYETERRGSETHVHIFDARRGGGGRRATVVLRD